MPTKTRNVAPEARNTPPAPSGDPARRARIAIAAYYRAERRGFAPGRELEDWLEAERDLDRGSTAGPAPDSETAALLTSKPAVPAGTGDRAKTRKSPGSPRRTTRR